MIADRIAHSVKPELAATMPNGPMGELQKLYFDVATSTSKSGLGALLGLVDADHVMFGTDYPFLPTAFTATPFDRLPLSDADKAAINRLTAVRLLPRYA
jgi:predicted TIM-barrel fold metal-dependent hydrolase